MDIIKTLPDFFGDEVEDAEMKAIASIALTNHIKQLKLAIAENILGAKLQKAMGNTTGEEAILKQIGLLSAQYDQILLEFQRLQNIDKPVKENLTEDFDIEDIIRSDGNPTN